MQLNFAVPAVLIQLPEFWRNFYFVNSLQSEFFLLIPFRVGFRALLFQFLEFFAIDVFCLCHFDRFLDLVYNPQFLNLVARAGIVIAARSDVVAFCLQTFADAISKIPSTCIYTCCKLCPKSKSYWVAS